MHKRTITFILALLLTMLTGCSSTEETVQASSLHVVLATPFATEEQANALHDALIIAAPGLDSADAPLSVTFVSTGDSQSDPMGAMAGMTQIAAMMASGEMELVLMDSTNARRHGDNASIYVPLSELFTAEEQEQLGIVPVTLPVMDDDGVQTGEYTAPCGVDLSACTKITQLMYTNDVAAYVLIDSPHTEQAKEVIRWLRTAE